MALDRLCCFLSLPLTYSSSSPSNFVVPITIAVLMWTVKLGASEQQGVRYIATSKLDLLPHPALHTPQLELSLGLGFSLLLFSFPESYGMGRMEN